MLQRYPYLKKIVITIGKRIFGINEFNRFFYINILFFPKLIRLKNFKNDDKSNLDKVIHKIKNENKVKAIILGNAASLNDLTQNSLEKLKQDGFLVIGLNRSVYKFKSDIQIWSDIPVMIDIIENNLLENSSNFLKVTLDKAKQKHENANYWQKNKDLNNYPYNRLFQLRTVLTAALHLCQLADIKNIYLAGVDLQTRNYFYKGHSYASNDPYEQLSKDKLKSECGGFTTQEIVKEVIESITKDREKSIYSLTKNEFLKTIKGLGFKEIR